MHLQFNLGQRRYVLKTQLGFFLLCFFFFCLLTWLGVWQLHRYHFKKTLLTAYQQRAAASAQPFSEVVAKGADLQFQHVAVSGNYVNELTMLVQNKFHENELGYEVLTPVQIPGKRKLLLVDRGWVRQPLTNSRQPLAERANLASQQEITGAIKLLNEYQFILGKNILKPDVTPLVMQKIDLQEISRLTHAEYYPFVLRLDPANERGFVRDWPAMIADLNPNRSLGYALQWFLMALVLCIAYLSVCVENMEKNDNANSQSQE